MVAYRPNPRYRGPDFFTYVIHDGLNLQSHVGFNGKPSTLNEITTHVRYCRLFKKKLHLQETQPKHALCDCSPSPAEMIDNAAVCDSRVSSICSQPESRSDFLNLCLTCKEIGLRSGDCRAEIVRAVFMLSERGHHLLLLLILCFEYFYN